MANYEHDIFISYSSASTVPAWLQSHFLTIFNEECINEWGDEHFRLFYWRESATGTRWPDVLKRAHARSKVMISILTPTYFRSEWCLAEWQTMTKREAHCKLPKEESLIFPILFSDGNSLPEFARTITFEDFREFAYPDKGFRETALFPTFRTRVKELLPKVESRLQKAPAFAEDWPEIDPGALQITNPIQPLTRLQ